ncbi:MAG: hypothetical protein LUG46_08360 [Erysipelotrichaceae bacterium]|nr:hypothetical protein [Erysipelotrichaceae bacterium]
MAKRELYEIGIIEVNTQFSHKVNCYNAERTICDMIKNKDKEDIQLVTDALQMYVKSKDKNIPLLSEYAKKFGIEKKIHS